MARTRRAATPPASDTAAAPKPEKSSGKVKAVVLLDGYAYHEVSGDPTTKRVDVAPPAGTSSAKGVEVEVSQAEFDRGAAMTPPGLAKPKSDEAKAAVADEPAE